MLLCFGCNNFDEYYTEYSMKTRSHGLSPNPSNRTHCRYLKTKSKSSREKKVEGKKSILPTADDDADVDFLCPVLFWSVILCCFVFAFDEERKLVKNIVTKISLSPHLLHFVANHEIVNFDLICYNIYFSHRIIIVSAHMYYIIELTRKVVVDDPKSITHTHHTPSSYTFNFMLCHFPRSTQVLGSPI